MNTPEMARCSDCYTLLFADEMKRCSAGHWTCLECACDCTLAADVRTQPPAWLQKGLEMQAEGR